MTDPTPERRWTLRRTYDGAVWFVNPDGLLTGMRVALDTLNEAEALRAERDALLIERADLRTAWAEPTEEILGLRERVRVLEAALWRTEQTEMEPDGKCGRCGFRDRHERQCPWRVLETDGRARQVGRALAGTEPPDAGEMLGGESRERVRVLEARLEKATAVIKALEATQLVAGVLSKAYDEWRGLAGAETEALYDDEHAASCDVSTSPHDYGWEKVTTCTCGTDGGAP